MIKIDEPKTIASLHIEKWDASKIRSEMAENDQIWIANENIIEQDECVLFHVCERAVLWASEIGEWTSAMAEQSHSENTNNRPNCEISAEDPNCKIMQQPNEPGGDNC